MNTVIIFYPELFKSYSKFERKVSNVLKNLDSFSILYINDSNQFIAKFASTNSYETEETSDWTLALEKTTHAIIFDDGEEFPEVINTIREKHLPMRIIKIKITRVINIKKELEYAGQKSNPKYEYIGRGSYWGNPYSMYEKGEGRDEVIRKFKYDFDFNKFPYKDKSEVFKLAGKRLGCYCKPASCHGDVLADFLNSWDDGK